jgi:bacterioferritin
MRHAEAIAERIVHLGRKPTTVPDPVTIGEIVREILEINRKVELGAIELYKRIIEVAEREGDEETRRMFERILADEEGYFETFSNLLEGE